MDLPSPLRTGFILLLVSLLVCPPLQALVSINDGKNRLDLVANANLSWDSNVFANRTSGGDYLFTAGLGLEFKRRAGLIALNGSVGIDATRFVDNSDQNAINPRFRAEFSKQTGRTTGALTLGAARQSRADSADNLRSESWLYDAGLNFKYPVIERYTISGSVGYSSLDYLNNSALVDLKTYSASVDLFYVYTSERDLFAGYRYRHGETSASTSYDDHAFTVGVSGKILPKIGGSVRVGYQFRQPRGSIEGDYQALTASTAVTWNVSKRINFSGQVAKDFSTTATNINMDALSFNLDGQYAMNAKLSFFSGVGYGINRFLGVPGADRRDTYFSWNAGVGYTMSERLKIALTYAYFQNWSTLDYSDFERNSVNLNLSSRF
jgi:hypothetical protein